MSQKLSIFPTVHGISYEDKYLYNAATRNMYACKLQMHYVYYLQFVCCHEVQDRKLQRITSATRPPDRPVQWEPICNSGKQEGID